MKSLESCLAVETDTKFSRKENGKAFELRCGQEIECQIYDMECVFEAEDIKHCDWLFTVHKTSQRNQSLELSKSKAYYVELKGNDHKNVCRQLFNAIDRTKAKFPNFDFNARIVSTTGLQPELITNEYFKRVRRIIGKEIVVRKVHKGNQFKYTENI
ncbi:MAG: hypothetical protein ABI378_15425 [Chitinophagaceae bacterium]